MGRARHRHWLREARPREYDIWDVSGTRTTGATETDNELIALCGYGGRAKYDREGRSFTTDQEWVTCPQCRSKLAKAALKARPAGSAELKMERDPTAKGGFRYQQGWRALIDGEVVAILGYQEHGWRIYPFIARKDDDDVLEVTNTYSPLGEDGSTIEQTRSYHLASGALLFKTKDDALMACEEWRAKGVLKTKPELIVEWHRTAEENRRWREQRRREREEKDTQNRETLDALREILAKETLSNFQRQGLMTAIAAFEAKVPPAADAA